MEIISKLKTVSIAVVVALSINAITFSAGGPQSGIVYSIGAGLDALFYFSHLHAFKYGLDGPLSIVLYQRQIEICMVAALVMNFGIFLEIIDGEIDLAKNYNLAEQRVIVTKGVSKARSILYIRIVIFGFMPLFATFFLLIPINFLTGWVTFHTKDTFTSIWFPLAFLFLPASIIPVMWYSIFDYLARDICRLKRFILN